MDIDDRYPVADRQYHDCIGPNNMAEDFGIKPLKNEFYYVTLVDELPTKKIMCSISDDGVLRTMAGEPLPDDVVDEIAVIDVD